MKNKNNFWKKPRNISIVIDNPSWIWPYIPKFCDELILLGDKVKTFKNYEDIPNGDIAIFLSCINIAPETILKKNIKNLVVHESDLPKGRGFSPLTWQILELKSKISICLIEMDAKVDAGLILLKKEMHFKGDELLNEIRCIQAKYTFDLCKTYLKASRPKIGVSQIGNPTYYRKRNQKDSKIDPNKTIIEQFNLLRVVDNEKYPAFFEVHGKKYILNIKKG